jgi:hypothetical protein
MSKQRSFTSTLRLALVLLALSGPLAAEARTAFLPYLELSAGPILGIDLPLRGAALGLQAGLAAGPFEAGLRASLAYDASMGPSAAAALLDASSLRIDLALGLGGGLRALVGGLVLLGEASLPLSSLSGPSLPAGAGAGDGAPRIAATAASWPNRFGLGATLARLPWKPLGAALSLEAELAYAAYRIDASSDPAAARLSGLAAFAAGIEASLALRLRWGDSPGANKAVRQAQP